MEAPPSLGDNLLFRLQAREIQTSRPGTAIRRCRELYEYVVPNHTVYDVECPDHSIRKFTNDGQYLICFGRTQQELVVYRYKGLGGPLQGDGAENELPPEAKRFDGHFTKLYTTVLVSNAAEPAQTLCKDFLLIAEGGALAICATSSQPDANPLTAKGALPGVPAMEVITLYLVRLSDGMVVDQKVFQNDFINLAHNSGVFLYEDLLAVLSVRFQSIHIFQVRESAGIFVDVRTVGPHCQEDDELVLQTQEDAEARFQRDKARQRRKSGSAAGEAVKEDDSDSLSERRDADSLRRSGSVDLDIDTSGRRLWGAFSQWGGGESVMSMGGGFEERPLGAQASIRAAHEGFGAGVSHPSSLQAPIEIEDSSILEERRHSHLLAGPSSAAAFEGGGSFPFKRLPEGPRETRKMSDEEIEAANIRAGHGEMHRRLEELRRRLLEEGVGMECWPGDGLHDEEGGRAEVRASDEVESRGQNGHKRSAEMAGVSHQWGDERFVQAGKRGKLGTDLGLARRLGKRDSSDIDDCPSDSGQEDAAEVPGKESARMRHYLFGGGLLGGQAECAEEDAQKGKDSSPQDAYTLWGASDSQPMRLHGGAPGDSHTVSYAESEEEEGEQMETGQDRSQAGLFGPLQSNRLESRSTVSNGLTSHGLQASRLERDEQFTRPTDDWEGAHRQLPEREETLRGLAAPSAWVQPSDEEDPMGRYSAKRPKSRVERMSAWQEAHWQLPNSDSEGEGARRVGGSGFSTGGEQTNAWGNRAPASRQAPSLLGGNRVPGLPLYEPFGSTPYSRQAQLGSGVRIGSSLPQGGGANERLDGLPNRGGAMVDRGGQESGRMKLAEGLGGKVREKSKDLGLDTGIVYNIEDTERSEPPRKQSSDLRSTGGEGVSREMRFPSSQQAPAAGGGNTPYLKSSPFLRSSAPQSHLPTPSCREVLLKPSTANNEQAQALRTVHGGVYTSDLIEQQFREGNHRVNEVPKRRPLGPEWGAPLAEQDPPLYGLFSRAGWNAPARSGFAHLHQAVGAVRAASRSGRSNSSGGEEGEGLGTGRFGSGGLLAAGRFAGLYSPYNQQHASGPRYEYVVSSRTGTESYTSSEPMDDVSMPTATSARLSMPPATSARPNMPPATSARLSAPPALSSRLSADDRGLARASAHLFHHRNAPGTRFGAGPSAMEALRQGSRAANSSRYGGAAESGRENQPGASLASGGRLSGARLSPVRGRPQGGASVAGTGTLSGLSGRPASHDEANSGEGVSLDGPSASQSEAEGPSASDNILGGIKQRLLSFIFRQIYEDTEQSPQTKAQRLKRVFYHFKHYEELVMWKVQFLDRHHLLLKFGSAEGVVARSSDSSTQNAFFAVYNLETTEILGFFQNTSEDFLAAFEHFSDHFRVMPAEPAWMRFISSYANNVHAREHLRKQKAAVMGAKSGGNSQVVKRALALLPFTCQSLSPSVYFDQSLFHYDEKLISASERHKPCMEHPIKFISRKRSNVLRFKIQPGPEGGSGDSRAKRVASYVFHPTLPFAISIQQTYMQPPVINFHFRWPV